MPSELTPLDLALLRQKYKEYLDAGLGIISDTDVAKRLGVPVHSARTARRRLGLPVAASVNLTRRQRMRETIAKAKAAGLRNPSWKIRRQVRPDLSNSDWCYLLGLIDGNGNWRKEGFEITVGTALDGGFVPIVCATMDRLNLRPKVHDRGTYVRIRCNSYDAADWFKRFKQHGVWLFPEIPVFKQEFLAGAFDADGGVKRSSVVWYQKEKSNVDTFVLWLYMLNIGCSVNKHRSRDLWHVQIPIKEALKFADLVPLRNPRKKQALDQTLTFARRYHRDREEAMRLVESYSASEVARHLGRNKGTVLRWVRQAGIEPARRRSRGCLVNVDKRDSSTNLNNDAFPGQENRADTRGHESAGIADE